MRLTRPTPAITLVLLLAASACGNGDAGDEANALDPVDDTAVGAPGVDAGAGTAARERATADTAGPDRAAADDEAAGDGGRQAAGPPAGDPTQSDHPAGPWAESAVTRSPSGGTATLVAARAARHDGYDRFVLEFSDDLPGYRIRYPGEPLFQCGSGRPIEVAQAATLQVELRRSAAHDDQGNVTISERQLSPGLPMLHTARLTCDYEGIVEWVLGVDARTPFRVFTLQEPARVVVDIRHR